MKVVLYLLVLLSTPLFAASPEAIYGKTGMVTSRSALASAAGLEIMKAGGNAVDGAVATAFALAVTYPSAGNLGGGGFAVVRLADGKVVTLDHRETAPASASRDMYLDSEGKIIKALSTASHKSTGTPGSVDGLITLLETYGSLSIKQVIAPAISLAEKGFPLSHD
ncbi:MAG: gamma-glutamyltransferase, partial [Candidatus Nitrotoga sp.]